MRIRMTVQLAGPSISLGPGDERDFPQDEAVRLIKAGFAVPVADTEIERAVLPSPPETRLSVLSMPQHGRERGNKKARR